MILKKNQEIDVLYKHLNSGKYARYTAEQVEAPERVYAECPKPSFLRWQQLIRECAFILTLNQSKSRCREKQRKKASQLQIVNRKLTAMNKFLMEENDRLQKQVSQLVCENGYMRQQLQITSAATTDVSYDLVVTTPQHSMVEN
ncbi:Homeobox-leucine zipper protein REVOLUTA [Arachis hypogaea]|nr:Homeobox-leucine zipper protein REVOLUTA [Arachis hypogaea]